MNKAANLELAVRKNPNLANLISRLSLSFTDQETGETLNNQNDFNLFFNSEKPKIMGKFAKKDGGKQDSKEPAPKKEEEKRFMLRLRVMMNPSRARLNVISTSLESRATLWNVFFAILKKLILERERLTLLLLKLKEPGKCFYLLMLIFLENVKQH